jgi:hypothetical protein
LIFIIISTGFYSAHPYRTAAAWVIVVLVSPIVLGIVLGRLSQKEMLRRTFQRIGINTIHEIPTAWDYKFSKTDHAVWVLVTLKDGSQVAGLYGSRSVASSEPSERDLYIQEIYRITSDGPWQRIPRSDGILIRGDQIRHIEFWGDRKEEDDVGQEQTETIAGKLSTQTQERPGG